MAARKMKWSPLRAVTLAGLTLAAVVVACDTNAPTALDDALLDVLASPEVEASADGSLTPRARAEQVEVVRRSNELLGIGPRPLIFIDGVEFTNPDGSLPSGTYTARTSGGVVYSPLGSLNPDNIDRIEIIKGSAAIDLFGDGAENGVIQIFTKEPEASEPEEPSAGSASR
ncbi:MAG: TonB-dependent receptor plug domain-containing protein [Gammaproteobacteria bacterium]|nr:TonB-dependent receptor plug domain-containing protein [Gammaproteobacteria bacterium]